MKILTFIVILLLIQKSSAQIVINEKTEIKTVIDKTTGKIISMDTIRRMIEQKRSLNLLPVINEYGEVSHHIFHGNEIPNMMDKSLIVKVGENFPPFIMKTLDNDTIYSSKLLGKIVILDFWMMITKKTPLSRFESLISASKSNDKIVPLIICQSSETDAREFVDSTKIKIPLVSDAYNFHKRYQIFQVPMYIIIDKKGKLVGYFKYEDELKIALLNLKD